MTSFDAIVIGGGHNGLVCRRHAGQERPQGAGARSRRRNSAALRAPQEFAPGFRASSIAHLLNRLHPDVVKALELEGTACSFARDACVPSVALVGRAASR